MTPMTTTMTEISQKHRDVGRTSCQWNAGYVKTWMPVGRYEREASMQPLEPLAGVLGNQFSFYSVIFVVALQCFFLNW